MVETAAVLTDSQFIPEVHLKQLEGGEFEVFFESEVEEPLNVIFKGKFADQAARDYANSLDLLFTHTEPGTELSDILDAVFHDPEGNEIEGDPSVTQVTELI